ncbi:hypothetical protein QBC38DRAFT_45227 [Podospora fimiseda]|uniref:Uncharacterized protein n=1 Tax=Podospora fimiseda TaxID=252190 RepID=A0AAN7BHZ8_9PEZI|nr:hypothetical protein QBC38DRAFT_45227 [Podospora fimiseda]
MPVFITTIMKMADVQTDTGRPSFGRKDPDRAHSPLAALFIGLYPSEDIPRVMFHGVRESPQEVRTFVYDKYLSQYHNTEPISSTMMLGIECDKDDRQELLIDDFLFDRVLDSFRLTEQAIIPYLNGTLGLHLLNQDAESLIFHLGTPDYSVIWSYGIDSHATRGIIISSNEEELVDYMAKAAQALEAVNLHPLYPALYHCTAGLARIPAFDFGNVTIKPPLITANGLESDKIIKQRALEISPTRDIINRLLLIQTITTKLRGVGSDEVGDWLKIAYNPNVDDDEVEFLQDEAEIVLRRTTESMLQFLGSFRVEVLERLASYLAQEHGDNLQIQEAMTMKIRDLEESRTSREPTWEAILTSPKALILILCAAYILVHFIFGNTWD